jgi:hypothetical protein
MNTQNEPLVNLINYLRLISRQHKQVKAFGIGESYEQNEFDNFTFPLIWLDLPISSSFVNLLEPDRISVTFTLNCFTNIINTINGNPVQVKEDMISKATNQLNYADLAVQDQLMNNAYAILVQLCTRISNDIAQSNVNIMIDHTNFNIPMILESIDIDNASRVVNKDLYKSSATITIVLENSYLCPINSYFDYNVE